MIRVSADGSSVWIDTPQLKAQIVYGVVELWEATPPAMKTKKNKADSECSGCSRNKNKGKRK